MLATVATRNMHDGSRASSPDGVPETCPVLQSRGLTAFSTGTTSRLLERSRMAIRKLRLQAATSSCAMVWRCRLRDRRIGLNSQTHVAEGLDEIMRQLVHVEA
mmetsp:Transcript_113461/g.352461  ORF Transcript_113461/g.352461 Transcript_113461/m.352461 type:complete len:103 (-) Transcript_113461:759-1067(-)